MRIHRAELVDEDDTATRLDQIGWGIFLVMIGTIWLVPSVPQGTWLVGTGVLLLLLNAIRSWLGIPWSGISVALGVLALAAGVGGVTGVELPIFPICLVILGVSLIARPLIRRHS